MQDKRDNAVQTKVQQCSPRFSFAGLGLDLGPWAGGRLYATMLAVDFGREGPGGRAREPPTPPGFF